MKQNLLSVGIFLSLFFFSSVAYAQNDDNHKCGGLDQKVEKLDSTVSVVKKALDKLPKMQGYVNSQYTYSDDGTNTFHIRRARLDFKGNLSKKLDYRFQVDFASSPKLVDAYVRYKVAPAFNVQFGQFKVPFSLESMMGPLTWEGIENAQVINKLSGYSDVSGEGANGRDLGISVYGSFFKQNGFNVIDYALAMVNGNGINLKDNNLQKNFAGKLEIHPIKPITLAASFYLGQMNGIKDPEERMPKNRYAFSFRYDDSKYLLRAEYLRGKTDMGGAEPTITDGYYAILGYNIKGKVMPILRYDTYRKDISAANGASTYYMAGLVYTPWKYLRLQLNYTLKDVKAKNDLVNQITTMVTFVF